MSAALPRLARRTAILLASVLVASVVVFAFLAVLPGDPAQVALGLNASPELVERTRHEFGTDRPLLTQYLDWLGGFLTGELGRSYVTREPIGPQVLDRLGVTVWLAGSGMLVALLIALPAGVYAALARKRAGGVAVSWASQLGLAVPGFIAGILLVQLFAVRWQLLPAGGWTPPVRDPVEFLRGLVLPALALGLVQGAVLTRYVRSAVLDVSTEDYLRTARAKGHTRLSALLRHGLRNAAAPVLTVLGLQLTTLLIGAVVVERVFVLPGLGSLLLDGVAARDLLVVQNVVMVLVCAVLLVNFVVDVLHTLLNPRLRQAA